MKVTWTDAWADNDESKPEDWKAELLVETIGWQVRTGKVVSVAQERFADGTFRCVTHIPKGMIRKVERL